MVVQYRILKQGTKWNGMNVEMLGPLVSGDEINPELRRRKCTDVYKKVTGSTKRLIAKKVRLEKKEGWRVVRKNAKSTRMAKPKPADEQLEDAVWAVLAQMGFKEMGKGRQFTVAVKDGRPPRQIDVFAKDDETIVIVECTQRNKPGKKNMAPLIEKIRAERRDVDRSIKKHYGRESKLKIRYVIATRNIKWGDADLAKCKDAQIAVIADGEIDYYAKLVQHLKTAARYQFLGHMFEGQKIDGLARKVVATRGKMGGETFYTFLIKPDELIKIAYVGHKASRDVDSLETYQRMLQPVRLRKIAEYINNGGKFPTNIVVNLKTNKHRRLKFESMGKDAEGLGTLHLPANYASAWIIDGQHRLYGYAYARRIEDSFKGDSTIIPVLAYENLPSDKEMNLFIDINSKQVKVNTGLLVELYADLHWESSDPEEAYQALLSRIASRLNSEPTSPLYERVVVTGKKKTQFRCLTQTSIRDGLEKAKLLGTAIKGAIVPGPFSTPNVGAHNANLRKAIWVITESLDMFASQLGNHWQLGDAPGGFLCTNNGIRALFHVMQDVAGHIRQKEGTDLCLLEAEETFRTLKPYLQVLINYFKQASPQEVQAFRGKGSSLTAVRNQAWGMEALVNKSIPDFKPAGLQDYLDSRDEEGTEEAAGKVTKIHRRLFDYVIGSLKDHYGTNKKAWWTNGIPLKIRQQCTAEWEAKDRYGEEEEQLFLISYIDICHKNWALVKDVISLDKKDKDNKQANTKWIKDLNEIRKITTHPERGTLTTDQVNDVKRLMEMVEQYFPDDGAQVASEE